MSDGKTRDKKSVAVRMKGFEATGMKPRALRSRVLAEVLNEAALAERGGDPWTGGHFDNGFDLQFNLTIGHEEVGSRGE